jgi:2'-5' RNA ligase
MLQRLRITQPLRTKLLHMTVLIVSEPPSVSDDLIAYYRAVGDRIASRSPLEPFDVVFERARRNAGGDASQPLVLLPGKGKREFKRVQNAALAAVKAFGREALPQGISSPHSTLLYGRGEVDEPVAPITWRVDELCLILSRVGLSEHEVVGRWPLTREPDLFDSLL